jgi:hypothetical protein
MGPSDFTSHPRGRCAADFYRHYPPPWPGSNPRPLGPMASTLVTTPPKRLIKYSFTMALRPVFGPWPPQPSSSALLSEASVDVSRQVQAFQGRVVSPTHNPQPGGPGYPFLSASSPLTFPAWEPLLVAILPPT